METSMFIFTFTSKEGNVFDGDYKFIAENKLDAIDIAILFETRHNKDIVHQNNDYKLRLDASNFKTTKIKKGFIHIR